MPHTEAAPPAPAFTELGLAPDLARRAAEAGWGAPTAIQQAAIPAILQGRDVLGLAPTGSGKTAAYLLPLLQQLLSQDGLAQQRPHRLRALVLAPTRELALQIGAVAQGLAPALKGVVAVGGVSINPQMMRLRGGAHWVVATPGRLLDLIEHRALRLSDVQWLVLDEADRLLEEGFAEEVQRVLAALPAARQTLMFSATLPDAVSRLADALLSPALRLDVRRGGLQGQPAERPPGPPDAPTPDIRQRAIEVDTAQRTPLLRHLIATQAWPRVLVFSATQYASELVAHKLQRGGLQAAALHGRLSQGRRAEVLADFHAGRLQVLVATDLAARGIDVAGLPAVVNHDLPRSPADHTHRIGRTARAGEPGLAISFICADAPGSEAHFRLIEKRQGHRVAREQVAGFEPKGTAAATPLAAQDPHGGVKGRRKSKKDKLREEAAAARTPP
jgi:ATP-dependent RNA helicase RhlE